MPLALIPASLRRVLPGLLLLWPLTARAGAAAPPNPSGFIIHRGTNLSHWLSQDFGWAPRDVWITENDIRFIARLGFDHVRLPIDERELWRPDGRPDEPEFARLLRALGWCRAAGLRVIVDLHTVKAHDFNAANEGRTNSLWTDPRAQEHFLDLWRQLSARLHDQPVDAVAYEILNEPVADTDAEWNQLAGRAIALLRAAEPGRVLVLGSNRWQIPQRFPALAVPAGDKNIILSFHTYAPLLLTHHLASWLPTKTYTGPVNYPGPIVDRATYERLMQNPDPGFVGDVRGAADDWNAARLRQEYVAAVRRARELGLQLYCGEFGCLPTVPRAARLAYYRDLIGVFESEGIAWCNWEYKGDFGLFEWHGAKNLCGAPDLALIDTLLHRPSL